MEEGDYSSFIPNETVCTSGLVDHKKRIAWVPIHIKRITRKVVCKKEHHHKKGFAHVHACGHVTARVSHGGG